MLHKDWQEDLNFYYRSRKKRGDTQAKDELKSRLKRRYGNQSLRALTAIMDFVHYGRA